MTTATLTRSDLIDAICKFADTTRSEAVQLLDAILEAILYILETKGEVKIPKFGSFLRKKKSERVGRNPKTGVEVTIPARNSVVFRPAQALRDSVE